MSEKASKSGDAADLGFDDLVRRLREVVTRLESGDLSLEDSLAAYEEGVALARRGHDLLDRAEKRVELLVRPPTESTPEESVPLE
ncbi:MAG: exodeoxyribonuclease VII small subunit [Deltaproteobacteria bacterium]|nr:exodeoxyribonuclease VII small subunit [Deltaproteobacteria bacterium]